MKNFGFFGAERERVRIGFREIAIPTWTLLSFLSGTTKTNITVPNIVSPVLYILIQIESIIKILKCWFHSPSNKEQILHFHSPKFPIYNPKNPTSILTLPPSHSFKLTILQPPEPISVPEFPYFSLSRVGWSLGDLQKLTSSDFKFADMKNIGKMGIHYLHKLNASNVPKDLIEKGQNRVIEASLTLIRERAKLKGELIRALGGAAASSSLLGVPLGHNSSFLQGPAFAPPRIREAIWDGSTNSTTEEGKELNDPRVLTDVGDVPIQELRDCGVDDDRLMNIISESVKLVMEQDPLRPLVLGGDHSISYPVVRAVSEKLGGPVDILHLDAHPDIYHSFEGNKYSHASSFARIMEGGYARRLLQVGIRSITSEGREQGKRFGVEQYEMRTFSRDREILENLKLGEGVKGVYISVDVDCLDPAFAPGVSHIEPGGLSFRDVLNILHNLQADVVGADVVEFNPQRDTVDGMTAMVAAKLVRELTAKISK